MGKSKNILWLIFGMFLIALGIAYMLIARYWAPWMADLILYGVGFGAIVIGIGFIFIYFMLLYFKFRAKPRELTEEERLKKIEKSREDLRKYYEEILKPKLQEAMNKTYQEFKEVVNEFIEWERNLELLGIWDEFSVQIGEGWDIISSGYLVFLNQLRTDLSNTTNPEDILKLVNDLLVIEKDMEIIGIENDAIDTVLSDIYDTFNINEIIENELSGNA